VKAALETDGQTNPVPEVQEIVADSPIPAGDPPAGTAAPALVPQVLPDFERSFDVDGVEMLVRSLGSAAGGTGRLGLAAFEAYRFYAAVAPDKPLREALMPAGQLRTMYDEELRAIWKRATVLDTAATSA
jgi:hypothetical protein